MSASNGYATGTVFTGSIIDSVDGDSGIVGNVACSNCDSYFVSAGSVARTFNEVVLGGLPRSVGVVWADGGSNMTVTFQAFDVSNTLLGTVTAPNMGDGSNNGTTAEDRFFGIEFSGGIKKIELMNSSGGLEFDHLQFEPLCGVVPSQPYCTAAKLNSLGCTPSISGTTTIEVFTGRR